MYAVTLQCEIPEERTLTVKLPDSIQPGNDQQLLVVPSLMVQAVELA